MTLLPALIFSAGIAQSEAPAAGEMRLLGPDIAVVTLDLPADSYVTATLVAPQPVTLDLMTPEGPYRRLLDKKAGTHALHFTLPGADTWLQLAGSAAELTFDGIVRPEAQGVFPPNVWPLAKTDDLQSPSLRALAIELLAGGDTDAFWAARAAEGTPMVEPGSTAGSRVVTFLWRGAQRNARLIGGPANDHVWLDRLGDSDVWFATFETPDTLRLSYQVAPDIPRIEGSYRQQRVALLATIQADPLNLHSVWPGPVDRFNQASVVALDNAPAQPGMSGPLPAQRGRLETLRFNSDTLGNTRNLQLYHPAEGAKGAPVVLVVFDGERFTDGRAPIPQVLDRLIAAGRLPPVHVIFIDSIDSATRASELPFNPDFARVLAEEILPLAETQFGLAHDTARTVLAGASYGGLASAWIAHQQPGAFGAFLSMSGSFWAAPEETGDAGTYLAYLYQTEPRPDIRAWLSAGIYETAIGGDHGIYDTSQDLVDVLQGQGEEARFRSYSGGHDYLVWRGALAEGLLTLYGLSR